MSRRKTNEEFVSQSKQVHGNKYDYSLVEYKNNRDKVKIICKIHSEFNQSPNKHLNGQGCPKCGDIKNSNAMKLTTKDFIEKSISVHGNRYDYSLSKYTGSDYYIDIICNIHGIFKQRARNHSGGRGCPSCRHDFIKENPTGWSLSNWNDLSKTSNNFDSFKVYIIKCYGNDEEFYKIGRTFMTIKKRFEQIPYNYEVVNEFIFETAKEAFQYEKTLKNINKAIRYIPKIKFKGVYECFNQNPSII